MGVIKQIAVHNGTTWQKKDIGVNAENVSVYLNDNEDVNIINYISDQIDIVNGSIRNINNQIGSEEQDGTILKRIKTLETNTPSEIDDRLKDLEDKVGEEDDDITEDSLFAKITSINNQISNKVGKSGDTMTGNLTFRNTSGDSTRRSIFWHGRLSTPDGSITAATEQSFSDGWSAGTYNSIKIESQIPSMIGTTIENSLELTSRMLAGGTSLDATVQLSQPLAWKNGLLKTTDIVDSWKDTLGINDKADVNGYNKYTTITVSHNGTSGTIALWRWGPIVIAKIYPNLNAKTANTLLTLSGTIPTGFRPTTTIYIPCTPVTSNALNGTARYEIDSSGVIKLTSSVTGNREFRTQAVWITTNTMPS